MNLSWNELQGCSVVRTDRCSFHQFHLLDVVSVLYLSSRQGWLVRFLRMKPGCSLSASFRPSAGELSNVLVSLYPTLMAFTDHGAFRCFSRNQPHLQGRPHVLYWPSARLLLRYCFHGSLGGLDPEYTLRLTSQVRRHIQGRWDYSVHCTCNRWLGKSPLPDLPAVDGSLDIPWLDLSPQGKQSPHEGLHPRFHGNVGRLGCTLRLQHFPPDFHAMVLLCGHFHCKLLLCFDVHDPRLHLLRELQ